MHQTPITLLFTELPNVPDSEMGGGQYLLSMWDCSAHIAGWHSEGYFHVGGVRLNSRAIRSWAELPSPVDAAAWGADMLAAAHARTEAGFAGAPWSEEHHQAPTAMPSATSLGMALSAVGATGATKVSPEVQDWVCRVAATIRSVIGAGQAVCAVWPYREGSGALVSEYLVSGFWLEGNSDASRYYDIGMAIGGPPAYRFHLDEPSMPDATEALHCLALIVQQVGAKVELATRGGQPKTGALGGSQ